MVRLGRESAADEKGEDLGTSQESALVISKGAGQDQRAGVLPKGRTSNPRFHHFGASQLVSRGLHFPSFKMWMNGGWVQLQGTVFVYMHKATG